MYDIVEEANSKIQNDKLNLANIVNIYSGIKDDDNISRSYEIMGIPEINKYYKILFSKIEEIDYIPVYKYKPEYVSYNLYGTSSYDYLILYANKISDKKKFTDKYLLNRKVKYFAKDAIDILIENIQSNEKSIGQSINVENYILYNI